MKNNTTNKLLFKKRELLELSKTELNNINGGSETIDWPITGCLCKLITQTINQN